MRLDQLSAEQAGKAGFAHLSLIWHISLFVFNETGRTPDGVIPDGVTVTLPVEQKIITRTTFIVGELISQLHTHQLHNFNCQGFNLCNAHVSLVLVCLAHIISQKRNYTTIMLRESVSNYTHTSYTTIIVGELFV